ncbi:MAG: type IV toxin-antitoxin system AbiEi family antitoxin domain-containing protein [Actinomycetota bacterium]|nr:type IV toxin-antitoxin system AbiEi family antitoxin domain-containing protein [Actinomycetota bacterium]
MTEGAAMPRYADPDPVRTPLLITREWALASGLTRDQIRQRVRSGRWEVVARGMYRRSQWRESCGLDEHALARIEHVHKVAAAAHRNPECVVGFDSAALLHGLPVASGIPPSVTLIAPDGAWTGRRPGIVMRRLTLGMDDVLEGPPRVTTPERTWLDLARVSPLGVGLAAVDAGLRDGILDGNAMVARLTALGTARGCRKAAEALLHASLLRESVLESLSWAYFVERSVQLPEMQVKVRDQAGRFVARVDFLWRARRLVGECDGRMKYLSADDLYREKRREDALRALGFGVVRWGLGDLGTGTLASRLPRADTSG